MGTSYDAATGQVTFAPKLTEAQRLAFRRSLIQPSQSDTEYSLKLQRDWIPRIMDRYSHSPTAIVLTPLPRGPFLELGGFSRDMNPFFQALSLREPVFRCRDTRSIFWKNRKTTLTHSTLTRRAARRFTETLVSEVLGRLRPADSKAQGNSGAELAVNGPRATNDAN